MKPAPRPQADAGFTLLELLVAITLLGFLSVALIGGLRFGTQIWKKSENASLDSNAVRSAQKILAASLARIYPKLVVAGVDDSHIDFDGNADRLTFLSTADAGTGQMTRDIVQVAKDGNYLAILYSTMPELARDARSTSSTVLFRRLASVDFAYFGASGDSKTPVWHQAWHDERRLPLRIRIRATLAHPASAPWPEMILAPRIAADVGCNFDALTKFCQGR